MNGPIVIDGQIFNPTKDCEAFFMYISSFSVFQMQWDSVVVKKTGKKDPNGYANRASLELLHRYEFQSRIIFSNTKEHSFKHSENIPTLFQETDLYF